MEGVTLAWTAPAECPSASAVTAEVTRLLGDGADRRGRRVTARADVEKTADGVYRVHLRTIADEGSGDRSLEGATCQAVADATALIVALAVDPDLSPTPKPTPSAAAIPAPLPPSTTTAAPEKRDAKTAIAPSAPPWRAWASFVVDGGTLPEMSLGGAFGGAWTSGLARIEISATGVPTRSYPSGTSPRSGADLWLVTAGARGLFAASCDAVCWYLGGGLELDHLGGSGFGVDVPRHGSADFVAVVATTTVLFPLGGPFAVGARLEGALPLKRQSFVLSEVGEVERPAKLVVRASFGPEARF